MEAFLNPYTVSLSCRDRIDIEFQSFILQEEKGKSLSLAKFHFSDKEDNGYRIVVVVDFSNKKFNFSYNVISVYADIISYEEVGGNFRFKCTTNLFEFDAYVCISELWEQKGKAIFD